MKHTDINTITPAVPGTSTGTGTGSGWIKDINSLVTNIKGGLQMARELQNIGQSPAPPSSPASEPKPLPATKQLPPAPPATSGFNPALVLGALIALGKGDQTVKAVAGELGDLTIKQFAELLKNVRAK